MAPHHSGRDWCAHGYESLKAMPPVSLSLSFLSSGFLTLLSCPLMSLTLHPPACSWQPESGNFLVVRALLLTAGQSTLARWGP